MKAIDRELGRLAAAQRQVFSREQALAAGLSEHGLYRRLRNGMLTQVGSRTYTFAATVLDYRGSLLAGLLDLGPGTLITARAGAALHGLDGFGEDHLDYLVPREIRGRHTRGRVRSSSDIARIDRVTVDGLAVTSATRTIIELLGLVDDRELGNAIDSACRKGLTAPAALRRRLEQLGRKGRAGVAAFERVMSYEGVQSWLERRFLDAILAAGLPRPEVQRIYRRDRKHVARVDFDFDPFRVVVEVGGRRGYMSAEDRQRQERRRNELQLLGKVVYFFTTEDVRDRQDYVVTTVRNGLGLAA